MIKRFGPAAVTMMVKRSLSQLQTKLRTTEQQALTGLKVERPSDAPTRRQEIDRLHGAATQQRAYQETSSRAALILNTADASLARGGQVIKRALEIAVQMANGIHSASARATAGVEIREMRNGLIDIANTDIGGRYLFAGDAYDAEPFDTQGVYQGSSADPSTQIGTNQYVKTGMDGSRPFAENVDVFEVLEALALALESNDGPAVATTLGGLREGLDQMLTSRAAIGFSVNRANDATETAVSLETVMEQGLADAISADPVDTYTELAELRTSYEAALAVSARSLGQNLFQLM